VSDILNELRKRHRNVTGGNPLIDPIQGQTMFSEAADEIERLTAERDEARQMYCKMTSRDNVESARYIADRHGWDCFKQEDGK
jgi:hypothetical protein